ncbi:hypothetical protein SAMD00019534_090190 [Acytostelium subglobosum LB1]|uniref:hypothetical protein n=1 Tax=Acytostelium subglobosum LB1 TaxID=1410327 RepID=UPI0006450F65|nr:hypothetical protein SAMD00019534_090190 [Acytostelium subglobosum LB1]GAM25844.1 hypothetical protein SAMD00019534_090190 [Acytostelium subglobosum LB1]|eukprot:XP_012751362.1 hypothetical protein SAMD00019534_090190 [Acytostelium subglobosum LB1]
MTFSVSLTLAASFVNFGANQCTDPANPCDFNNPANWIGGQLPSQFSPTASIDNTVSPYVIKYIKITSQITLSAFVVNGPNVTLTIGQNVNLTVVNAISMTKAQLETETGSYMSCASFYASESSATWTGASVFLGNMYIFQNSILKAYSSSIDVLGNPVNFDQTIPQPELHDHSTMIIRGYADFSVGLSADATSKLVINGSASMVKTSNLGNIHVDGVVAVSNGGILATKSFTSSEHSKIFIGLGFIRIIDANVATLYNISTNMQSNLVISNTSSVFIGTIDGQGRTIIQDVALFNQSCAVVDLVSTFSTLTIGGKTNAYFSNANIVNIQPADADASAVTNMYFKSLNNTIQGFDQALSTNNIHVLNGSSLELTNNGLFMGKSSITLEGTLVLPQNLYLGAEGELTFSGPYAYLSTNASTIQAKTVTMNNGRFDPQNTTINGSLVHNGGEIFFIANLIDEHQLVITGDYKSSSSNALVYFRDLLRNRSAKVSVQGNVSINGTTFMINWMDEDPAKYVDYHLVLMGNVPASAPTVNLQVTFGLNDDMTYLIKVTGNNTITAVFEAGCRDLYNNCSGHGKCNDGACVCEPDYLTNNNCSARSCHMNCSGAGSCQMSNYTCQCNAGLVGDYCEKNATVCGTYSNKTSCITGCSWCQYTNICQYAATSQCVAPPTTTTGTTSASTTSDTTTTTTTTTSTTTSTPGPSAAPSIAGLMNSSLLIIFVAIFSIIIV